VFIEIFSADNNHARRFNIAAEGFRHFYELV